MSKKLLLLTTLASLPLVSLAQTEPASSRFYAGVGANLLTNVPFNSAGVPRLVGPSLTGGMYLSPRLALQASVSYHWQSESHTFPSYNYGQGTIGGDSYLDRYKYFMVPVLLRYTFTPFDKRFKFDGLIGATAVYSHFYHKSTTLSYTGVPYSSESNNNIFRASLTLGPAIRYAVSPKVEITANGLVNMGIGNSYRFSDRLFLNALVGAQYSFGQR
jgi:hypothetical protein